MLTEQQIEQIFCKWYDKRRTPSTMPPGSFESYLAGWMDAKEDSNGK